MDLQTWRTTLLDQLELSGPEAQATAQFIRQRRVKVGFRKPLTRVSAYWTVRGNVYLNNSTYSLDSAVADPRLLCLIVHEAQHVRQGIPTALSVYGELEAWQLDFRLFQQLTGRTPGPPLSELLALPLSHDRDVLRRAQVLMREYGGKGYRADLLPLYPWGNEVRWFFTRKPPTPPS